MLFEHAVSHLKTVNISKILYPILNEVFQTEVRVFFFFVCVCVCVRIHLILRTSLRLDDTKGESF
jgi:hypothetical protein